MPKILAILVLFVVGVETNAQTVQNGVLDLREVDLSEETLQLDGAWEFYWKRLLTPEDSFPHTKDFYAFPSAWNGGVTRQGVDIDPFGYATYRLQVVLPKSYPPLALYIKHVYSSYALYVNGSLTARGGQVGTDNMSSNPKWVPLVVNLPKADTLEMVMQISNYKHKRGGGRASIVLGSEASLDALKNTVLAFDLLLSGIMIMAGFFFFALFFLGLREKAALYFALFCITFSYRIVAADDYSLLTLYPDMDWSLNLRLVYLSLFLPTLFYALYTHALFPLRYRVGFNPFYVLAVISGLFSVITIVFPTQVFTWLMEPFLILTLFAIVLMGYVYYRALVKNMVGAKYAVVSSFIALCVFGYKIIIFFGGYQEVEFISFVGYLTFFFFQSLILFFIFTNSLKKAKEEAEQASRSKSDFLSMMSHEIRTPMNAVIGLSNFLLEEDPKKEQIETLSTLKFSAQNLLVIINDILDFSKIEAEKIDFELEPVNIRTLLDNLMKIFRPLAMEKGLELNMSFDDRIPEYLICDQTRTSQVLTNLISNSLKFTVEGTVSVSLHLESIESNQVEVLFEVKDTGIGIPEAKQQDIFKSFTQASSSTTRRYGGTGLGLSITRKLLELQGSSIHLQSDEGKGTTFYFRQKFHVASSDDLPETSKDANEFPDNLKLEVLLVEDNEINIMVTLKFLEKWGARATVARNGREALDAIGQRQFHLILMDLQMPVMDGYEAVREIRKRGIKVPVIALTASALLEEQRKIYDAGMDDFVTKPFDPQKLRSKIIHFTQ